MSKDILFIHGMFQNGKSWAKWVQLFEARGFNCSAPSWPLHEGDPADLRMNIPDGLGGLTLAEVIGTFETHCERSYEPPILVGHSVGGLVAQVLASRGLAHSAICISSVAPNNIVALDWHLMKNVASITNPLKGHQPYMMSPEGFHENFCNTMSSAESAAAYEATATHDSRQVLRDCLGKTAHIDLSKSHVPLLFVAGDSDHIIPSAVCRRNCEHYKGAESVTQFIEFPKRGHFICGEPGWEEIAGYCASWISDMASMPIRSQAMD